MTAEDCKPEQLQRVYINSESKIVSIVQILRINCSRAPKFSFQHLKYCKISMYWNTLAYVVFLSFFVPSYGHFYLKTSLKLIIPGDAINAYHGIFDRSK